MKYFLKNIIWSKIQQGNLLVSNIQWGKTTCEVNPYLIFGHIHIHIHIQREREWEREFYLHVISQVWVLSSCVSVVLQGRRPLGMLDLLPSTELTQPTHWRNLLRGILVQDNKRFTLLQDNFKLDRVFYTNHNNFIGCTVRDNHVVWLFFLNTLSSLILSWCIVQLRCNHYQKRSGTP